MREGSEPQVLSVGRFSLSVSPMGNDTIQITARGQGGDSPKSWVLDLGSPSAEVIRLHLRSKNFF